LHAVASPLSPDDISTKGAAKEDGDAMQKKKQQQNNNNNNNGSSSSVRYAVAVALFVMGFFLALVVVSRNAAYVDEPLAHHYVVTPGRNKSVPVMHLHSQY